MNSKKTSVLAVEDHPIERRLLQLLGKAIGMPIQVVCSGDEALEILAQPNDFGVVLMDWWMPGDSGDGMDGLECTRRIRQQEIAMGQRVSIIGVTAHAMLGDRKKCLEAGMDDYLSKPYTTDQFRSKILKWINHREDAKTAG